MLRLFHVSPTTFRRVATSAVCGYALLVVTGGAVRLTGSGLGCPDWPACTQSRLTPALSFHPMVEFSNRVITIAVSVVSIAVFVAALARRPRRRDLTWWSFSLVVGLIAQIVLGGLVVLFKLNAYLVALHFLLTFAVLTAAVILLHRARHSSSPAEVVVGPEVLWVSRVLVAVLVALVSLGTLVSGSGPHAGAPGTPRIAIAFRDIAEVHSSVALFLVGLTLATLFLLHQARVPAVVERRGRTLLELLALQGLLGYTQYFLHDAALVVECHLAGATGVLLATLSYYLSLHRHLEADVPGAPETPAVATALTSGVVHA